MRGHVLLSCAAALGIAIIAVAADWLFPLDLTRYETRSRELLDADGAKLNITKTPDGTWRLAATPDAVDPNYLAMLLATEDRRFWRHPGVDPLALARAAWQLIARGRVVSGGSTLTMQAARLLTPHRHDMAGKLLDILRAVQLEAHLSKREILSIYLTLAPFGGNIEGVRAASLIYFDREPKRLSDAQAALLVALPRSPARLRPDRHFLSAAAAERSVLQRLALAPAGLSHTTLPRRALPALAPHLAARLEMQGAAESIRTTLDSALQRAVEELAGRERRWLGEEASVAALIVRNRDCAVLAYLGGADWLGPGGMVDMVRARRSPGSTLKPFIYGLAFDDTLVAPDTLIDDAPMRVGDYAPQNFDRNFHGLVSIREALQQSYNLPAVAILHQVGPQRLAALLRQAGARIELPRGVLEASLPLALGGVGISLEDLTMLYVALANDGRVGALRYLAAQPEAPGATLMTREAVRAVGDILRGTPLPDGVSLGRPRAIAYKTGTSYGFRDAWSVGYSPAYTVAVWVGRVEGSPRPGAVGRNTAAPLLFKLFDLLPTETETPMRARTPAIAAQAHLAPALKRFAPRSAFQSATAADPKILFPPPGATLELTAENGAAVPIALEAGGGTPPYRWAVNGVPLAPAQIGTAPSWLPDGPGFTRVSVTDAANRTATASVRLQ